MGMRNTLDRKKVNATPPIDKALGTAYDVVASVAEKLPIITYLEQNVDGFVTDIHNALDTSVAAAQAADTSADLAKDSETAAKLSQDAAHASELASAQSESNASASESSSLAHMGAAAASEAAALVSQNASHDSQVASAASETAALASKQAAALSESNAGTSEVNAGHSADAASQSAGAAGTAKVAAEAARDAAALSESNASASAAAASDSKAAASQSASNAVSSATQAGQSLDDLRNTIAPLLTSQAQYTFTAAAGQTEWTPPAGVTFIPGSAQVFVNGIRWNRTESFDDSTGAKVTFVNGLTIGYSVTVVLINTVVFPVTGASATDLATAVAGKGADMVGFVGANGVATTVSALALSAPGKGSNLVAHGAKTIAQVIDPANQSDAAAFDGTEQAVIKQAGSFARVTLTKIAQWVMQSYRALTVGGKIAVGENALAALADAYDVGSTGSVIAIGRGAMGSTTQVKKAIAIGPNSQAESPITRDNIGIGEDTLRFVTALTPDYDQSQLQGTRNIAIGGNAGRFVRSGYNQVIIGRNAGQGIRDNIQSTVVGANAAGGYAPIGLSGVIENWAVNDNSDGFVAVGSYALARVTTGYNVAVGTSAASSLVAGRGNTAVGHSALSQAEVNSGFNGNSVTNISIAGTYSQVGTTLTLTIPAHGLSVGFTAGFRLLDGASQTFQTDVAPALVASVIDANTFTVTHPISRTASGNAQLYWYINTTAAATSQNNTVLGALAANAATTINNSSIIGYRAGNELTTASASVAIGYRALTQLTGATNCVAIGSDALRLMTDGSNPSGTGTSRIGIGAGSRVSGDNQVQLGDSSSTTYVYGTVQNRSDARDKADVRDTVLGLDFINALRPVDYKWDMRDDYIIANDDGTVTKLPKDGSKTRARFHHGLIAQDVQALIEKTGIDFGGFQDHAKAGGCDVLSIGYDELIAPLIKAVHELSARVVELEAKNA
jgi:hypothetical protein